MKKFLLALVILLPLIAFAGRPFEATLEEMAISADHILIGRVAAVDMIDEAGKQVSNVNDGTGPGLQNLIRLRLVIDKTVVSNAKTVPAVLYVPLAPHLHYSLGQIREAHANDSEVRLIFLKGANFEGIKPGVFLRPLNDMEEALRLRDAAKQKSLTNSPSKPP